MRKSKSNGRPTGKTKKKGGSANHEQVSLSEILPSPENDQLYRPISTDDPEIIALAQSSRQHGLLEPLIVTLDNYIVSGHRRYAAAKLAGLRTVPVRRLGIRRSDDLDAFVRLLREHNRQRDKTNAEKLRKELVSVNFERSDKDALVLLIVSDFDPEGEDIAHSFARSMRDDFSVFAIQPIKVALTVDQVKQDKLPPIMQAKATSSCYKKLVKRHGRDVFELEALPPETLQSIVRSAIEGVIDRDEFEDEIAAERNYAGFLTGARRTEQEALQGVDLEGAGEE